MNTDEPALRKRRRGQDEIDAIIAKYHAGGLSVACFAAQEGLNASCLYTWLRRARARAPDGVVEAPWPAGGQLTLCFPTGLRLLIPYDAPGSCVERLVDVLECRR